MFIVWLAGVIKPETGLNSIVSGPNATSATSPLLYHMPSPIICHWAPALTASFGWMKTWRVWLKAVLELEKMRRNDIPIKKTTRGRMFFFDFNITSFSFPFDFSGIYAYR
jgi:hypothetical protein